MILLYNQQIEKLRSGECSRFRVSGKVSWIKGTCHKVKSDKYGSAKAHVKIVNVTDLPDGDKELELKCVTVFDYLKARRPGWEQAVIL